MPERQVLMLMRVSEMKDDPRVPSVQIEAECGCRCWIGDNAARALRSRPDIRTSCMQCLGQTEASLLAKLREGLAAPVAGTREAMEKLFGEQDTAEHYRRMHMTGDYDIAKQAFEVDVTVEDT